jgi:hypothetical protein
MYAITCPNLVLSAWLTQSDLDGWEMEQRQEETNRNSLRFRKPHRWDYYKIATCKENIKLEFSGGNSFGEKDLTDMDQGLTARFCGDSDKTSSWWRTVFWKFGWENA